MSDYPINDIIDEAIQNISSKWEKEGISSEGIVKRIKQANLQDTCMEIVDQASDDLIEYLKERKFELSYKNRTNTISFIAHMEKIWGKCFVVSEMMYDLACDTGDNFNTFVSEKVSKENKAKKFYTFRSLQSIHGRACQVFLEILYLVRLGFADAAYARWRTLYELCCVGTFIKNQKEQIAKQYWEYSQTEKKGYKWMTGAQNTDGTELKGYNFASIERFCGVTDIWKEHYKLACFLVHASAQGTFKRLSNYYTKNIIPVGQSDYGIHIPAEHSALCLQWITTEFITVHPYFEGLVECKTLTHLSHYVQEAYSSTANKYFPNNIEEDEKPAE